MSALPALTAEQLKVSLNAQLLRYHTNTLATARNMTPRTPLERVGAHAFCIAFLQPMVGRYRTCLSQAAHAINNADPQAATLLDQVKQEHRIFDTEYTYHHNFMVALLMQSVHTRLLLRLMPADAKEPMAQGLYSTERLREWRENHDLIHVDASDATLALLEHRFESEIHRLKVRLLQDLVLPPGL